MDCFLQALLVTYHTTSNVIIGKNRRKKRERMIKKTCRRPISEGSQIDCQFFLGLPRSGFTAI